VTANRRACAVDGTEFRTSERSSAIDGRTGTVLVQAGNVVQAGAPTPLVLIRAMKPIQVRFSLPQRYLTQTRQRLAVSPLTVRATPKSEGANTVEGKLTVLENTVDTSTGTLTLRATFDNDSLELWPGATVDAVLVLDVDKGATVAPAAAIQDGQDGSYSFVIEGDTAVQRAVHVSRTTKTQSIVQSGLNPGDVVVTDGQVRLRSGVRVAIKSDAPKPTSSSDTTVGVLP
jgi:multidrug efflux system membrane fusion protein